ncbi:hypothetical protein JCM19241_5044 [Vibrio ishigakensis]|uniref:Uncharacterized protein n=1 Tax=Vibrio ishigakensis TaxID=1481914 RepID=A0A0B8QFC0_9VIBR|nr:hypothetical protein JCM19241_5044 [Vibrio ishigakensis]
MKKHLSIVLSIFIISACKPHLEQSQLQVVDTHIPSSWYEIPQYYAGVPKYSGAFGTYTYKHIPVAVYKNDKSYQVFSDNLDGNLKIYLRVDNSQPILIHTEYGYIDPHINASLNIDFDDNIWIYISARNNTVKGRIYKGNTKNLHFELVGETDAAYPQLHVSKGGLYELYSKYKFSSSKFIEREIWFRDKNRNYNVVKGGHYQISTLHNGTLYTVYNNHPRGRSDERENLYGIKLTPEGQWHSFEDNKINIPALPDDNRLLLYNSSKSNKLVFLKDIIFDAEGNLRVLFIESDSQDPTIGKRKLMEWTQNGVIEVSSSGHNYNSATYIKGLDDLYLLNVTEGEPNYTGGKLQLRKLSKDHWIIEDSNEDYNFSYVRRVENTTYKAIASVGSSSKNNGGTLVELHIIPKQ